MAKYSTGGVGSDSSGSCELCGAEGESLQTANVAGAQLQVCSECAQHGDKGDSSGSGGDDSSREETNRRRKAAQNMAKLDDARKADTGWQEETEYEDDPLPYLVRNYGTVVEEARQDAGLQIDELAEELDADAADIVAVEQGRAARAGIAGSLIEALEDELGIELVDE